MVDVAEKLGLRAAAPLLPGHGTSFEDFATTGWQDWYGAADRELDMLVADSGESVVVAGQSLGSLIAIHLAAAHGASVRALILLSPPTRLARPWPDWFVGAVGSWIPEWFALPKGHPDVMRPEARADQLGYRGYPLRGAAQVRHAGLRALSLLSQVRCPTLIVEGQHDHVCRRHNGREILTRLSSQDKHAILLGRAAHLVTRDHDAELLAEYVHSFLKRVREESQPRAQRPVEP